MSGPLLLGIEIGGTKLQLGLGRGDGHLLALIRLAIDPKAGAEGILAQIAASVGPLVDGIGAPLGSIEAVGIGFGGPVDAGRGVVTVSHQVEGWNGFPLADWVRDRLGVSRVRIESDADTAALGEARFGAGVGLSPLLYVTIGSGVGGGLIIDGQVYRGAGGGAVEIGHLWVNDPITGDSGRIPVRRLHLEEVASGWGIGFQGRAAVSADDGNRPSPLLDLAGGQLDRITAEVVAEAARRGDAVSRRILSAAVAAMAEGLGHAVTILAPRRIILGGGVSLMGEELWFAPIRRDLDKWVFAPFRGTFDVVPAALTEEVVVHGALALATDIRSIP